MAFGGGKKWYTAFLWWVRARLCGHTQTRFAGDLEGLDQTFCFTPPPTRGVRGCVRKRREALSLKRRSVLEGRESGPSEPDAACDYRVETGERGGGKGQISEPRLLLLAMRKLQTYIYIYI